MKQKKEISLVIDASPLISITAALGNLDILKKLYDKVIVPFEVCEEVEKGGRSKFAVPEFREASWLDKRTKPTVINDYTSNVLDKGEASVIMTATKEKLENVCIDEEAGRRFARLAGLNVTGAIGILLLAREDGMDIDMKEAIKKMKEKGAWISQRVENKILKEINKE